MDRHDIPTALAIGFTISVLSTFGHEALGHGAACVLVRCVPIQVSSTHFLGDKAGLSSGAIRAISLGGTIFNLVLALVFLAALRIVGTRPEKGRVQTSVVPARQYYVLWFGAMSNLVSASGYILFGSAFLFGDYATILEGTGLPVRIGCVAVGVRCTSDRCGWRRGSPILCAAAGRIAGAVSSRSCCSRRSQRARSAGNALRAPIPRQHSSRSSDTSFRRSAPGNVAVVRRRRNRRTRAAHREKPLVVGDLGRGRDGGCRSVGTWHPTIDTRGARITPRRSHGPVSRRSSSLRSGLSRVSEQGAHRVAQLYPKTVGRTMTVGGPDGDQALSMEPACDARHGGRSRRHRRARRRARDARGPNRCPAERRRRARRRHGMVRHRPIRW